MTYRCGLLRSGILLSLDKLSLCRLLRKKFFASKSFMHITATNIVIVFSVFNCNVCLKYVDKSVLKYGNEKNYKKISKYCFSINCVCRKCVGFCNPQQEGAPRGKMHQTNVLTKLPRTILSFFILAFNLGSPLNTLGPQGVPPLLQTKSSPRNELRVKGIPATRPLRTIYKDDHRKLCLKGLKMVFWGQNAKSGTQMAKNVVFKPQNT